MVPEDARPVVFEREYTSVSTRKAKRLMMTRGKSAKTKCSWVLKKDKKIAAGCSLGVRWVLEKCWKVAIWVFASCLLGIEK